MLIYPAIDLRAGRCVRLRQGDYERETVFADNPGAVAARWVAEGADRLHVVDLDGAKAGEPVNEAAIRRIVDAGVPVQLGGGLRKREHIERAFDWGVRWAVLGTQALCDPAWLREMANEYPGRIVLGVDARNGFVATEGWRETSTIKAVDLVREVEAAPLFAVVFTDIVTDGMMAGPNFTELAAMRAATRLPVIASGGIATADHARMLAEQGTFAAIVGRALYEGAVTLGELIGRPGVETPG